MTDPPRLVLATGNAHKIREIEAILRRCLPDLDLQIVLPSAYPGVDEPEEDGLTFESNALIKARYWARQTGILALADDSGLVVDALGGRPGIRSARYGPTPQERNHRVLSELENVEHPSRTARFVCVAALADPAGPALTRQGRVEGRITLAPRGKGGFGYDPIFEPLEESGPAGRTLAEFDPEQKNAMSHRGYAIKALAPLLSETIMMGRLPETFSGQPT